MRRMYALLLCVVLLSTNVFAWNDEVTHPHMTTEAIKRSELNSRLQKNLNLPNGIETLLTGPVGGGIGSGLWVRDYKENNLPFLNNII